MREGKETSLFLLRVNILELEEKRGFSKDREGRKTMSFCLVSFAGLNQSCCKTFMLTYSKKKNTI